MNSAPAEPKVLVVDDDAGLLRLMAKALRREGFHAVLAASEEEMQQRFAEGPFALMMVDLRLQETTGPELLERTWARGIKLPFVVITGQGDERVAVEMMKKGALDYIVKDQDFLDSMPMHVRRAVESLQQKERLIEAEIALKREHAFISAILNTAGALVIVLDASGRIVRFNRAAELVTGYSAPEVLDKRFIDLIVAEDDREPARKVHERILHGEREIKRQGKIKTKAGEVRLIAWSSTQTISETGTVHLIRTGIDVTERRRLEQQITEVSGREQRRIGQDLHDGLGQHLTGIELMTQCLHQALAAKKRPESAQAAKISEYVREAIRQSKSLARGLSPVELDKNGLMSALAELTAATAERCRIECKFECPLPLQIDDNQLATQLYRIAQEAVNNGVKHARATRIVVRLWSPSRGIWQLAIQDNGQGFRPAQDSSGLGLGIMRYRATLIDATLEISSREGGGTEVICTFNHAK